MSVTELLQRFADPEIFATMSWGDKLVASLYVTALGMIITFAALVLLWGITIFYSRLVRSAEERKNANKVTAVAPAAPTPAPAPLAVAAEEDEELIAVISAAVAASMNTSIHNIVVRNIVRVGDATPAWGRAGRNDQMSGNL